MSVFEENIDLDALFDSLSISEPKSDGSSGALKGAALSAPVIEIPDVREISALNVDMFLFDPPMDQC